MINALIEQMDPWIEILGFSTSPINKEDEYLGNPH